MSTEERNRRKRERYKALKASGLCGRCGRVPERAGLAQCERCIANEGASQVKLYYGRKSRSQCTRCDQPSSDTSVLCETHRQIQRGAQADHYARHRKKRLASWHEYYERRGRDLRKVSRQGLSPGTRGTSARTPR